MNWLVLAFSLQLGWLPTTGAGVQLYEPTHAAIQQDGQIIIDFNTELRFWKFLYIGGELDSSSWKANNQIGFWPDSIGYGIRAGLRLGGFEFGYEHFCIHPSPPYIPFSNNSFLREGSYDEFHVKFSGSVNLF